jgi:ribose 5-phosphate isomerase RpiB
MSRPVVTARLLDELQKSGAEIRLPKDALITPAARDWLKANAVPVTWEDCAKVKCTLAVVMDPARAEMRAVRAVLERLAGPVEVIAPAANGTGPLASAVRRLCGKINRREVSKGVVFTADPAVPLVVANKHDGIRAAIACSLMGVEEACRELGVNVLVVDTKAHAMYLTRQMIERLMAGPTSAPPEIAAMIEATERSGGREDW